MKKKRGKAKRHPNSDAGRPKGALNKRTLEAQRLADELGVSPLKILLLVAKGDWKGLGCKPTIVRGKKKDPIIPLSERVIAAKEACPYIYPKLKHIDHSATKMVKSLAEIMAEMED